MKILVIRFNAIGDVVITSALCAALKKSIPDAQVDYLMYHHIAPLFYGDPNISTVLTLTDAERKNPLSLLRKVFKISNHGYDIIVDASSTPRSELISLFSRSARFRIGRKKRGRGFCYTHKIEVAPGVDKLTERLSMLAPLLDSGVDVQNVNKMALYISSKECMAARNRMVDAGVDFNRPVFAFNVSAKYSHKKWCLKYMREVVHYCLESYGAQVVLCAGLEHEKKDALCLHKKLGHHPDIFSGIGISSLRELAATFENCDLFVGNEGGPRHIAHSMGLPTVSVFSPAANRNMWLPEQGARHKGVQWQDIEQEAGSDTDNFKCGDTQYFRCYNSIRPEHVTPLIDQVISNINIHRHQERCTG